MAGVKSKKVRRKRNSFVATYVKGIRAEREFWDMCNNKAIQENTSRNELIIRVVSEYCKDK